MRRVYILLAHLDILPSPLIVVSVYIAASGAGNPYVVTCGAKWRNVGQRGKFAYIVVCFLLLCFMHSSGDSTIG